MNYNGLSNKRITQIASATQLSGGEYVVVYQDSTLKKITISQISAGTGTVEGGIPTGGITGQYLRKSGNSNYQTEWATLSFNTDQISEGSGNLYWTNARFDTRLGTAGLNANNITSGTIADARFPATLPSVSGANLTNLNAGNISTGTISTNRLPAIALQGLERLFAVGELSTVADFGGICDHAVVWAPMTINAIDVVCPDTPATGAIVIDIVYRATPGGPLTSRYNTNTKPSLSCNGYANWATFAGSNLPDTTSLAQGAIIGFKIVSAPFGANDLYVTVR
jgi:hypothetical protein